MQWNIGAGKIATKEGSDLRHDASYDTEDLDYIERRIRLYDPDIITLQEVHKGVNGDQAQEIASVLGYEHLHVFSHSVSHIDPEYELSQAIICRFPMPPEYTSFHLLADVGVRILHNGEVQDLHEKGVIVTTADLGDDQKMHLVTTHMHPFRRFKIALDSDTAKRTFAGFAKIMETLDQSVPCITQGDFNIDKNSLMECFPKLFEGGFSEVVQIEPTSPRGSTPDHVLYRRLKHLGSRVDNNVLTDHYPIISRFEIV